MRRCIGEVEGCKAKVKGDDGWCPRCKKVQRLRHATKLWKTARSTALRATRVAVKHVNDWDNSMADAVSREIEKLIEQAQAEIERLAALGVNP